MTRVAFVYTHFPHYRDAVFRSLRESRVLEAHIFYDHRRSAAGIKIGHSGTDDIHVPTRALGKLRFQWSFLHYALVGPFDVYVFLGNPYIATTWLYALIARIRGRRVFFWTHGWISSRESGVKAGLRDAFYRLAHGLLLYGDRARTLGIARGFQAASLIPIYNSLDYALQKQVRCTRNPDWVDPYFLCVSRLVEATRIDLAITALARLSERGRSARLIVVGDGPARSDLEARASRAGVSVEFAGAIYDEAKIAGLMASCAAVVSPGKVGLLAMHALAYGVPVVTHDCLDRQMPEVEALRPDSTGLFFSINDIDSLVEAMERALSSDSASETSRIAIAEVEVRWTPEVQVRLIEDAVANPTGGSA